MLGLEGRPGRSYFYFCFFVLLVKKGLFLFLCRCVGSVKHSFFFVKRSLCGISETKKVSVCGLGAVDDAWRSNPLKSVFIYACVGLYSMVAGVQPRAVVARFSDRICWYARQRKTKGRESICASRSQHVGYIYLSTLEVIISHSYYPVFRH